jgi:hypothetical protein
MLLQLFILKPQDKDDWSTMPYGTLMQERLVIYERDKNEVKFITFVTLHCFIIMDEAALDARCNEWVGWGGGERVGMRSSWA